MSSIHDSIRAELKARFPALNQNRPKLPALKTLAEPHGIVLGRDQRRRPVTLTPRARMEHCFILGATGSGKSRLLLHFMRQAIKIGEGLLFLDPHGNNADSDYRSLLVWLAKQSRRVHVVDFDSSRIVGFNPLACPPGTDPSVIVGNVMDALAVSWEGESFSQKPTIERNLSAVLTALVELGLTFCEAPYLLDPKDSHSLRKYAIEHVTDPYTREELRRLHELSQDGRRKRDFDQEIVGPNNRLARLLRPPVIRTMLGQTDNCLDVKAAMDNGEIILANLSGGSQVYNRDADLFGRLLTRSALFHAQRRTTTSTFSVVLDEAHRFLSSDIPVLLAEIRKYGVSIVAAMQWLEQARTQDDNILAALLNVNCKICFRLRDAEESEKIARTIVPLNLERPITALIKPTVVGHRRTYLKNESKSENQSSTESSTTAETIGNAETRGETHSYTHAETSSTTAITSSGSSHLQSKGESEGEGESSSEVMIPTDDPSNPKVSRTTAGSSTNGVRSSSESIGTSSSRSNATTHGVMDSETFAASRSKTHSRAVSHGKGEAHTRGNGHSEGKSEALEPILETLPSAVHSMQNELYAAGLLLRSLPTAVGYLNYVGKNGPIATLFTVPLIITQQATQTEFESARDGLLAKSGIASSWATATQAIVDRKLGATSHKASQAKQPKPNQKPPPSTEDSSEFGAAW